MKTNFLTDQSIVLPKLEARWEKQKLEKPSLFLQGSNARQGRQQNTWARWVLVKYCKQATLRQDSILMTSGWQSRRQVIWVRNERRNITRLVKHSRWSLKKHEAVEVNYIRSQTEHQEMLLVQEGEKSRIENQ